MLQVPERFAEVNIVSLRILKSEELTPELVYLFCAGRLDLIDLRLLIDQLGQDISVFINVTKPKDRIPKTSSVIIRNQTVCIS